MDIALRLEVEDLYAEYAACIDEGRFDDWPELFTEDCSYRLMPRENHDRKLPLCTLAFESKGMLKDRVYGVSKTLFHAPYYQRHLISGLRILESAPEHIRVQANYLVIRTKRDEPSEVFNTGRYVDWLVREDGRLKFREKLCVFDSELIPNSIIYPI